MIYELIDLYIIKLIIALGYISVNYSLIILEKNVVKNLAQNIIIRKSPKILPGQIKKSLNFGFISV